MVMFFIVDRLMFFFAGPRAVGCECGRGRKNVVGAGADGFFLRFLTFVSLPTQARCICFLNGFGLIPVVFGAEESPQSCRRAVFWVVQSINSLLHCVLLRGGRWELCLFLFAIPCGPRV